MDCSRFRWGWPEIGSNDGQCVVILYQRGFDLGKKLHAVERERRDRYIRALVALLEDIPTDARGCDFNFVRGLHDGMRALNFLADLPDG